LIEAARPRSVREIQRRLEAFYALEAGPDVTAFVRIAGAGERETLLVREEGDALEVGLLLPPETSDATLDEEAQRIEGVSHFVFLAERARTDLDTTELELELQAEVDKFVMFAFDGTVLERSRARSVRYALFDGVSHLHRENTERGHRYRLASSLAERLAARLAERSPAPDARRFLQRFYRAGQAEKIRLVTAT
jgi:hypothetical protein